MYDSFKTKKTLKIGKKTYTYFSFKAAEKNGLKNISSLPFSIKILLENLIRNEDGSTVELGDIKEFEKWKSDKKVNKEINLARYADLKIGVVPVINLEWIQKIHRDTDSRGYSTEAVTDTILRRMHAYVHCICPQFTETDINFQRVPVVDTSNPLVARWIPTADESLVVIRFKDPHGIDFPYLVSMIHDSWMSRANSIVIPGGKLDLAMQLILTPLIGRLVNQAKRAI